MPHAGTLIYQPNIKRLEAKYMQIAFLFTTIVQIANAKERESVQEHIKRAQDSVNLFLISSLRAPTIAEIPKSCLRDFYEAIKLKNQLNSI
jgi:hypothetical protein